MIPEHAVEAAVGSFFAGFKRVHPESRADMRAALEAAAPILLSHERQQTADAHRDAIVNRDTVDRLERELVSAKAEAWDEGVWFGGVRGSMTAKKMNHIKTLNPYRSKI